MEIEPITVSIGVAMADVDEAVSTLIDRADAAMYRAKRNGHDCRCAEGAPDAVMNDPNVISAYLGKRYAERQQRQGEARA